jgi:outer membrane protein assembly factor BamB
MLRPLVCLALVAVAAPAPAVIKVLTPLGPVIKDTPAIFVAEVDKVEPDKPGVVFKFVEDLKGKAPAARIPVNLTGDAFAKKDGHTKVMLDRLAPGRKLVLFVLPRDGTYTTFGFLEGTWFQMRGTTDPDTKAIRWAFLHCEPYFRRTFKGTTAELRTVVADAVAGKKEPPPPDEKEPHGYGPVAEKTEAPKKEPESGAVTRAAVPFASIPFHLEPVFGVIPSSILLGPLAILAAVFPATFGGLMSGMGRWRALLVVVSVNSILASVYYFLQKKLPDAWWCGEPMLMGVLLTNVLIGVIWAGRRYRLAVAEDSSVSEPPTRAEFLGVAGVAVVVGLMLLGLGWWFGRAELFNNPGREFTAAFVGLAAAAAYSAYRIASRSLDDVDGGETTARMSAPGEGVALSAALVFGAVMLTLKLGGGIGSGGPVTTETTDAAPTVTAPKLTDFELWYETAAMDKAMSAACVTDRFVYLGGYRQTAFTFDGILVCVNRATGKDEWVFDSSKIPADWKAANANGLRTVYSTPTVADGKLYFGEGLHTDFDCRLFCLDAATGRPLWAFQTRSHTEGGPVVADGKVYFSAGDDGLYCADAGTGKQVWQYQTEKPLHIDTPVTVANGRVFGGSGYNTFTAFAVDAATGQEVWKKELPLRSFGTPRVSGKDVFYGLGTGNLTEDLSSENEPGRPRETAAAGMIVCFDVATGAERWKVPLPASAHTNLAADGRTVYAACRDGWMYALDRSNGKQLWRASSGLPIVCGPVVATDASGRFPLAVYLAGPTGQVTCHDPVTGVAYWGRGIPELVGRMTAVQAQPTLLQVGPETREVFVPVTLTNRNNAGTKAGIVRFTDTDPLFPLLVKGLERYEKAGFVTGRE